MNTHKLVVAENLRHGQRFNEQVACPGCLANNIFITSDNHNHTYCNECKRRLVAVQHLREFHCLSFKEASRQLGMELNQAPRTMLWKRTPVYKPAACEIPDKNWQKQALSFVLDCHKRLMGTAKAQSLLYDLGFTDGTMQQFYLGWYEGVPEVWRGDKERVQWPPAGIVIPTFETGGTRIVKMRVRPVDGNGNNEYVSVSGTAKMAGIYGDVRGVRDGEKPVIVLRTELEAMLVEQFAGDVCCPLALGGSLLPDEECDRVLMEACGVIYAIGNKMMLEWWRKRYWNVAEREFPEFKDVDGFEVGVRLRRIVLDGVLGVDRLR